MTFPVREKPVDKTSCQARFNNKASRIRPVERALALQINKPPERGTATDGRARGVP